MGSVREVERKKRKIAALIIRAEQLGALGQSDEYKADYARHLCVLISGFFERAVAEIIAEYASGKAPHQLQSYINYNLRYLTNVDKDRLAKVLGHFDDRWRIEIDNYVIEDRKAALDSIVGLRNDIAHGGDSGVSLVQVKKYWQLIQEITEHIEDTIFSRPSILDIHKKSKN